MKAPDLSVTKHRRSHPISPSNGKILAAGNPMPDRILTARALRTDGNTRRVLRILQLILHKRPLRVCEVAREVHMSPSHLQHVFKRETGISLGHLLTEQRLQRSVGLLMHSEMNVKEIASSIGYVHAPSFIRAFQRRFGRTPDLYRRRRDAID